MASYHVDYTAEQINAAIGKSPIIQDGYWYIWDIAQMMYVETGVWAKGVQGEKGEQGYGLLIIDQYNTLDELRAAVTSPNVGDNYYVGTAAPYNVYTYTESGWLDGGVLSVKSAFYVKDRTLYMR